MTPSLEGWPTKAKEAPSPHEVRLAPLDTNPVFSKSRSFQNHLPAYIIQCVSEYILFVYKKHTQ